MRTIEANGHKIAVFDDIEQLTSERFSKFNKFMMLSDSIGNSFADIERVHLSKLYLVASDPVKMKAEINNLRLLIYNVLNEISPRSMAFACLVSEIDGKQYNDITDGGLDETRKAVDSTGLTIGDLKKNSKS